MIETLLELRALAKPNGLARKTAMATLAETLDAPCALPSAKRRTPAMTLYIKAGAHMHGHAHHSREHNHGETHRAHLS